MEFRNGNGVVETLRVVLFSAYGILDESEKQDRKHEVRTPDAIRLQDR